MVESKGEDPEMSKLVEAIFGLTKSNLIKGIESQLRRRKRAEQISLAIIVAASILEVWVVKLNPGQIATQLSNFYEFLESISEHNFIVATEIYGPSWELISVLMLIAVIVFYLLLKRSRFLFNYAEEPFRYTFWVKEFECIHKKEDENSAERKCAEGCERLVLLLRHDFIERLNTKIRRLSLLNSTQLKTADQASLNSHIFIEGSYAIRQLWNGEPGSDIELQLEITPMVRIGPKGNPSKIATKITIPISAENKHESDLIFETRGHKHQVERLVSSISTEIYRQIKIDLDEKMDLFPTKHMRAIGLYHEADDFAQSNTLDAYQHAIELYRMARNIFDVSLRRHFNNFLTLIPFVTLGVEYRHFWAKNEIGYAKCLIYKRLVSAYTGRNQNPIFTIPHDLEQVIARLDSLHGKFSIWQSTRVLGKTKSISKQSSRDLNKIEKKFEQDTKVHENSRIRNRFSLTVSYLTFPRDKWSNSTRLRILRKPRFALFERQKKIRFEAYVVLALAYRCLPAYEKAQEALNDAKATAPAHSEEDPLFLLA